MKILNKKTIFNIAIMLLAYALVFVLINLEKNIEI